MKKFFEEPEVWTDKFFTESIMTLSLGTEEGDEEDTPVGKG